MSRTTFFIMAACIGLAGCSAELPEPEFSYQKETGELHPVPFGEHKSPTNPVQAVLLENFGTPNRLVVWEVFPLDYGKAEPDSTEAAHREAGWKIKEGRDLYMVHCLHCHGVAGDGNGPTAKFLDPLPRDYRNGVFKFTSTEGGVKPSRNDLRMIVNQGIAGTSMPAFKLLGDEKVDRLVEYVRFLAMRGEYERRVLQQVSEFASRQQVLEAAKEQPLQEVEQEIIDRLNDEAEDLFVLPATDIADDWSRAELPEMIVQPREASLVKGAKLYSEIDPLPQVSEDELPTGRVKLAEQIGEYWLIKSAEDEELGYVHNSQLEARTGLDEHGHPTAESLARGKELYLSEDVFCYKCHGLSGRGDGPNTEIYWPVPKTTPERMYEEIGLHDDWGQVIIPRNLTRTVYRGGRRPIDLYRRIRVGIKGTPMPGYSTAKYQGKELTDEDMWAIVNYITWLPFEQQSGGKKTEAPPKVAATGPESRSPGSDHAP